MTILYIHIIFHIISEKFNLFVTDTFCSLYQLKTINNNYQNMYKEPKLQLILIATIHHLVSIKLIFILFLVIQCFQPYLIAIA